MNCRFCGTMLPDGAQFCGECGRPVPAAASAFAPRSRPAMPSIPVAAETPAPRPESFAPAVAVADSEYSCPQCGAAIDEDDVFCGECGFVLSSSYLSAPADPVGDVRATTDISDAVVEAAPESDVDLEPVAPEPEPVVDLEPEPVVDPEPEPVVDPAPDPVAAEPGDADIPDTGEITEVSGWVEVAGDPASEVRPAEPEPEAEAAPEPEPEPAPAPPKTLRAVPDPFPWGKDPRLPTVDLEATRVSASPPAEERFVLQFSTGESVTVSGAGLVGRNPASQPGEFVDQLVTIFDAGKSVSKTHLEFGQDGGRFWVSDRYSTNGSTVRQPDLEPKRCEPGRRYFVARGTRVDIGDQFFVVS